MIPYTTFCIVDNSLKDFVGHHFEYVRSLLPVLQSLKIPSVVLANRSASSELKRTLGVEPVFRRTHYATPCRIRKVAFFANPAIMNYSFFRDMQAALNDRTRADWILFAPNIDHMELLGWAWWLRSIPVDRRPQVRLLLRWSYFTEKDSREKGRYSALAEFSLRQLEQFPSLRLVTDSERLASEHRRLTQLPINVLPIPHTQFASTATLKMASSNPLVVFLGGARSEKGFPLLIEAAPQLLAAGIQLTVQCHLDDSSDRKAAEARIKAESMTDPGIRLIKEPLDSVGYYALLRSADIIVAPYRKQYYRSRTSGIVVEALAAGKPVVVPAGTWMADQIADGAAGRTFADGDPGALVGAIKDIATRMHQYSAEAVTYRERWLTIHNPTRLVESLLQ